MRKQTVRQLKKGEYFRFKKSDTAPVWVRGEYNREAKKSSTYRYDDVNRERLLGGDRVVFVGFTF